AVSEPMRKYVAGVRGTDRGTVTIHNGFHPELFPAAASLNAPVPVLAFCGNPRPWHGLDRIPLLLAALRQRGLGPVARIIGGPARPGDSLAQQEFARLEEQASKYSVRKQIDLVGSVSQQEGARLLAGATVAVAPFPPEPFFYFSPIKLFEYMAAGLPVVSVDQGDIAQLVGEAGILVAPGDDMAFAAAVEKLLRDEPFRRQKGAIARERAFGNFTWDHTSAKLERLFHELVASRAR
ncbi:MAG: glycosyltransferase family 4 protein, partial [Actinomycetota bacterium]